MQRTRLIIFAMTLLIVGTLAVIVSLYARGWRLNSRTGEISPNGLLVIKSVPDGAEVIIDGELQTATNATIPLPPKTYDISIVKEGYITWNKRLDIEKEEVSEVTAHLFRKVPSLTATTFSSSLTPVASDDLTKIAYVVPPSTGPNNEGVEGLWVIETINLPIGFTRDPRQITDGDIQDSSMIWSPNGREILLTTPTGVFLLDATTFTPQASRINITATTQEEILEEWEVERQKRLSAKLKNLPDELIDIANRRTAKIAFSPDEDMILYTASSSASIPFELIKQLPGSSNQKQIRDIEVGHTYIYDIEEDRNFFITDEDVLKPEGVTRVRWFPTSRHIILAKPNEIVIMDYDGTNRQVVYSGSYVAPHAFPVVNLDRLLILTNLGANDSLPNLYSLSLK